jgi:hypothetical protein
MRLSFTPTLGRKIFYAADKDDDHAPMLELRFHNEFNTGLDYEQKCRIAARTLRYAARLCLKERKEAGK